MTYARDQFSRLRTRKPKGLRFLGYVYPHTKGALDVKIATRFFFEWSYDILEPVKTDFLEEKKSKSFGGDLSGRLLSMYHSLEEIVTLKYQVVLSLEMIFVYSLCCWNKSSTKIRSTIPCKDSQFLARIFDSSWRKNSCEDCNFLAIPCEILLILISWHSYIGINSWTGREVLPSNEIPREEFQLPSQCRAQ